ncbi:MAG: hypothetical protein M4D80_24195 [Myxococcota bacterium]|nr:hypothetical protein [Myxococcota bacterium]
MRVLCAVFMLATGCLDGGGGKRVLATGETPAEPTTTSRSCAGLPMDSYSLGETMTIEAKTLRVSVSYGGGCEDHEFAACWDGTILESSPSQLTLTLAHDNHDDLCDAFVTRDLFIDISALPGGFGAPARATTSTIRLVKLAN